MAVSKYKTKKGVRYLAEVYQDGAKVAVKAGFTSRLEAHQWEKEAQETTSDSKPPALALWEVVTLYLLDIEHRRKVNTFSYKKTVLNRFKAFFNETLLFDEITRQDVKDFLKNIAKKITPKSANKHRIELSSFWSWCQVEGYATSNLPRQIEAYSVTKSARYIPKQEHISKALKNASQFERDFITALLHTAGRISELREATWEDIDLDGNTIRLWTSKRRGGDREPRTIAMSKTLHEIFSRLSEQRQEGETHVFINPLTGTGYTRQSREIKKLFHNVCKKAEVPLFTAHSLRHYVATHFNDPRRAQLVLGHMNIRTTEIYLHELGVDRGVADIFETITNQITNEDENCEEKGVTVLQ